MRIRTEYAVLFGVSLSIFATVAQAEPPCTQQELNQLVAIANQGMKSERACAAAIRNQASLSPKKICAACSGTHSYVHKLDAWMGKHPHCASHPELKKFHKYAEQDIRMFKKACGI